MFTILMLSTSLNRHKRKSEESYGVHYTLYISNELEYSNGDLCVLKIEDYFKLYTYTILCVEKKYIETNVTR